MGPLEWIRGSYGALKILYRLSGIINLFCKKYDREANCAARRNVMLPEGTLNGQDLAPLADLPYGAWRMGRNGCEVIAAYNALQALGRPEPLPALAQELERGGLLFNGFGGTNLGALSPFFRRREIPVRILRRCHRSGFDAAFSAADCAVLSYWTGKTLRRPDKSWNTLHTVSVHHCGSGIEVCNVSSNGTEPLQSESLEAFLRREGGAPVCLFVLGKIG